MLCVRVVEELVEVLVCEDLVDAIVVLWHVEHVRLRTCERGICGQKAMLILTCDRPQVFVLGSPEGGVEEVGQDECQGLDINVEEVDEENSKDDCMNGR